MIPSLRRALSRGAAVTAVLGLLAAGACSGGGGEDEAACVPVDNSPPPSGAATPEPTETPDAPGPLLNPETGCYEITYLTSFGAQGRDAYAWVADELGYFADENIQINIQPGVGSDNLPQLTNRSVQFAAGDLSSAILDHAGDEEARYAAVAGIHQQSPSALMTDDPDISSPLDLEGRTVYVTTGAVLHQLFPAYADAANIDAERVDVVPVQGNLLIPALANGDADAVEQFSMGLPLVAAAVEGNVTVLPYTDVLRDLYGTFIYANSEVIEDEPDLAIGFRTALMRGLDYAIANPEEAGQILADNVPEADPEVAAQELILMDPLVQPFDVDAPLGAVDGTRVSRHIGLLESAGLIDQEAVTPEDVIAFELTPSSGEE